MANLKAVLTRPKVSENYSRNAFDRSCSPKLTYQLGGLQPFFAEPFIAGSHVKLNRSIFQRTAAVTTPAFPTVDTHCEFFYVPLRLLMTNWANFKLRIQDFNSSNFVFFNSPDFNTPQVPQIPSMNLLYVRSNIAGKLAGDASVIAPFFSSKREACEANRLLDALGYGYVYPTDPYYTDEEDVEVYLVNTLKLQAYQKIYYDHFRNTSYESNVVPAYNLDRWSYQGENVPAYEVARLCTYRYVNYRKDYYNSIYPALNFVTSDPSGLGWSIPSNVSMSLFGVSTLAADSDAYDGGQVRLHSSVVAGQSWSTVQQIRAAFALDKLLRASAYAPKHVKDQFEARFGVKGVESEFESVRIGAMMNSIVFQEVTDTASNLGAVGGKGVGSSGFGDDIEFTCKEDCIIMGLMYSLPRSSYDSWALKNWNGKLSPEDFFQPEFMNLGMQPMYASELYLSSLSPLTTWNYIVGYKPRYSEYKVGIDQNHGVFNRNRPLSNFVVHSGSGRSAISQNGVNYSWFKVSPTDMDSIFAQATDPSDEATDKFITYLDVKCICNQNMSVHGQPVSLS